MFIDLAQADGFAVLSVRDTGIGIDRKFLPYVFEPFRRADNSMRRVRGGLGLGLTAVQFLVERHGGTVAADSEGLGCGAVFTVRLPLIQSEGRFDTTAVEHQVSVSLSGLSVLVIDDDLDSLHAVVDALTLAGAVARAANSVTQGLMSVQTSLPDVVICDIAMPLEDGFAFIAKLRALPVGRGGQIPAIALTAQADAQDRLRALTSGFQMHLAKPADLSKVVLSVAALCGRIRQ